MAAPGAQPAEFVEGWLVAQLLGEGAYGEVRLLVHARSGAAVAVKAARGGAGAGAAREAALHRALRHPHVLRCLGARAAPDAHYTFLEYAPGGELFDRIEPDEGVPPAAARRHYAQLLRGLAYLHERGVAHRDIKPENLLLDARDDLKISDFGMATLFRRDGRERLLTRVCGTAPYAAPEVLAAERRGYRAPPADLWAAGVVLLAMLTGELPWERAHASSARYAAWARGAPDGGAWRKVRGAARPLLRTNLHPEPARRAALPALLHHPWTAAAEEADAARGWRSQPAAAAPSAPAAPAADADLSVADMDALISHSQPARADDLLAGSPGAASQAGALAPRMTRVWVAGGPDAALAAAARALDARRPHPRVLALDAEGEICARAFPVRSENAAGAGARTLLEFRRWRGCGMRFKRRFVEWREALRPLAPPRPGAAPDSMDVA